MEFAAAERRGTPRVLGVYLGHDLGACLLAAGQIVAAIEEERLSRFKHGRPDSVAGLWNAFAGKFGYFPWASVSYCLEAGGIGLDDLDLVMVGDDIWGSGACETIGSVVPIKDRGKVVFATEPRGGVHHYHHALSAFFASPFEEAAVLVIDADGSKDANGYEAESGYVFRGRRGLHEIIFKNRYLTPGIPRDGVGWMYEQISRLLGFCDDAIFLADAGKTMGLAAYGLPRPEFEPRWITTDGFRLDFSGFKTWLIESAYDAQILRNPAGLARRTPLVSQLAADVAHKAQVELEGAVLHLAAELRRTTRTKNLCMAGGVALNSVANGLLVRQDLFERVFVQPAANDGGQAIGLAYHGHLNLDARRRTYRGPDAQSLAEQDSVCAIRPIADAYGGRSYTRNEIGALLKKTGLPFIELSPSAVAKDAAAELCASRFVAWFQAGSEFGPRALGHRSILADPRGKETKLRLNANVKFRESFRPFAPSVLREFAAEVFELSIESPYMLIVAPIREAWRERVPAVAHVDGTARIHTVDSDTDPLFYRLIEEFGRVTGIPLLLNTSLNLRGMPIAESPLDALQCFLFTELDCLYMECFKLEQPPPSLLIPSLAAGAEVSLRRRGTSSDPRLVLQGKKPGQNVQLDVPPAALGLIERLDGTRSVAEAYQKFLAEAAVPSPEIDLEMTLRLVKQLLRAGAMRLRAGAVKFGGGWEDVPWWQCRDP
jgi:carbamoyltransferase